MGASLLLLAQSTNLNLDVFRFRPQESAVLNQVVGMAILLVLIVAAGVGVYFWLRRRSWVREMAQQREEARLRLMISELNLGRTEVELLRTILGAGESAGDTAEVLDLMESRQDFEEAVARFRDRNPNHAALKRISQLRQRLDYGFSNIRNPFNDTRMLAPGTRMRCRIRTPKREVSFLTSLVGVNEHNFIIRPPTSKGKPVTLGGVRELHFLVSRENDAQYEFSTSVEGQLPSGLKPVLVKHTRAISRMLFRNAERVDTNIPVQLFVIRQEYAQERAVGNLRALDSQYRIDTVLKDLSIGGALAFAEGQHDRLHDGDMAVFRLPDAQIKGDIVAQVVGIFPRGEGGNTQLHLQFVGMKELNRLKLGKYMARLKEAAPPPPTGERPAPAAS